MSVISTHPSVGPFVGVTHDKKVTYPNGKTLRFVVYGAYNVGGLIGSEHNGVAILLEDPPSVVCDNIAREQSGYFGPSQAQKDKFEELTSPAFTYEQVLAVVRASDRNRGVLD